MKKQSRDYALWKIITFGVALSGITFFLLLNILQSDAQTIDSPGLVSQVEIKPQSPGESKTQSGNAPTTRTALVSPPLVTRQPTEPDAPGRAIDRIRAIQEKTALHKALLEDHAQHSRYPAFNRAFSEAAHDPVKKRYDIDERTTASEDGQFALTIWSDRKFYLQGDRAQIHARITDAEGSVVRSRLVAQVLYQEQQAVGQLDLQDPDGDGVYSAEYAFPREEGRRAPGLYKVLIVSDQEALADALTFMLSDPKIELTGNYRDQLTSDGDLMLEAEVRISQHSRYYVQASLYTDANTPVGETQYAGELSPGVHWVPLTFYGLMFQDVGEPGPYLLKNLSLSRVTLPVQRAPLIEPGYFTHAYALDQFKSKPYGNSETLAGTNL